MQCKCCVMRAGGMLDVSNCQPGDGGASCDKGTGGRKWLREVCLAASVTVACVLDLRSGYAL